MNETIIAPPDILIRYLAAFSRFFREGEKLCAARDHAGILLTGYAANALHNVPDHLRHFDQNWTDSWFPVDGEWAEHFRVQGAPEHLVAIWNEIFTPQEDANELGLQDDVADLDLPHPVVFDEVMELFRTAFLSIRYLRGCSKHQKWQPLDPARLVECEPDLAASLTIIRGLSPLPAALVHWSMFDREAFLQNQECFDSLFTGNWSHPDEARKKLFPPGSE